MNPPLTGPLHGRRALVCGGTRGIGHAAAQRLAEMGAAVTVLARDAERCRQVTAELPSPAGASHRLIAVDASQPEEAAAAVRQTLSSGAIEIVVNNSGGPPPGPVEGAALDGFVAAFRQHLVTAQAITMVVLPGMKERHFGRVINVISTSVKMPIRGLGVSNTVRAAVAQWAKTLSVEVAPHGITVNNVLPGATRTDRLSSILSARAERERRPLAEIEREMLAEIPAGRFGDPREIAAAIGFLASPDAAYINGTNLTVDGGRAGCL